MRRGYSEEQILAILHEVEAGRKVDEVCRSHCIARHTYYRWKSNAQRAHKPRRAGSALVYSSAK
jgi:transposase-like protein